MTLHRFSNFAVLENFCFSGTMKARKLKVCINVDNDWVYIVYWNKGQGSITVLELYPLVGFQKIKMHFAQ